MDHYAFLRGARPGDIYRVTRYMVGRLYTPVHDTDVEGQEAIVVSAAPAAPYRNPSVTLRVLETGRSISHAYPDFGYQAFELVRRGDGVCTPGVHYQFTPDELRDQRWDAFCARVRSHDFRHQGFSNAATYLAYLYLANESRFVLGLLPGMRRKDGTVNAGKVEKAFGNLRLRVDAWAFECPLEVPAEFNTWRIPGLPRVDWAEVAKEFAEETTPA